MTGEIPVFNRAVLEKLGRDTEAGFVPEVIELFFNQAPKLLATMSTLIENDHREALRRVAHSLKSNCGTVGAMVFAAHCEILEQTADTAAPDELRQQMKQLEVDYAQVKPGLEEARQTLL